MQQRGALFASLVQHGLFQVLTDVLDTQGEASQLKGADVLMSTLHNDPSALRAFLVKQEDHALFSRIVQLFVEGEEGVQAQLFGQGVDHQIAFAEATGRQNNTRHAPFNHGSLSMPDPATLPGALGVCRCCRHIVQRNVLLTRD